MTSRPATDEPADEDALFDDFLYALDGAADPDAVRREWLAAHPFLEAKLRQFEALEAPLRAPAAARRNLGRYIIRRQLPHSGMGVVYVGFDPQLKRQVIIKTFPYSGPDESLRPLLERFNRERRVLAQLHHTHIVPIYDAGQDGPLLYYVMPYIRGASLHEVVRGMLGPAGRAAGTTVAAVARTLARRGEKPPGAPPSTVVENGSSKAEAAKPETRPTVLPAEYIRSAVEVMIEAARAVHHAHSQPVFEHPDRGPAASDGVVRGGVLHRDIKPANVLIEPQEIAGRPRPPHVWLIDLGLARFLDAAAEASAAVAPPKTGGAPATLQAGACVGTPNYMAPEQYDGRADVRSDVWGLGATLYELLTLRPTFPGPPGPELESSVRRHDPAPPRRLVPNLPRDLEAICLKCVRKDPAKRFASAADLADDLQRWLDGEPTRARGAYPPRRGWMWARRHRAAAVALIATLLLLAGAAVVGFDQARARRRDLLLLSTQNELMGPHIAGWSARLRQHVADIPRGGRASALRDLAAGGLRDPDATLVQRLAGFDTFAVAFGAAGERVLAAGAPPAPAGPRDGVVHVWGVADGRILHSSRPAGTGPVAFAPDGTPLLLYADADDRLTVVLWDCERGAERRRLRLSDDGPRQPADLDRPTTLALAPDGSALAAAATLPGGESVVRVWDCAAGRLVREIRSPATALAVAPGGALLAVGDADGRLTVWPLPSGEPVAMASARRAGVDCLALHSFPLRRRKDRAGARHWLLAAGHAGGTATVWDVDRGALLAQCSGSEFGQDSVAFSPDGTTLATVGRDPAVRLWDVMTGRPLLKIPGRSFLTSVAFAPDGRRLVTGSTTALRGDGGFEVFGLENGRGLTTLRGLSTPVVATRLSPDGRRLAALSHDWQVAVWDLATERLEHLFEAPAGLWADNADLAFSPDGTRLAFAAHREVLEWDLATAEVVRQVSLPPGLADRIRYQRNADGSPRLLHFHSETRDGRVTPFSEVPWREQPRVGRLRDPFDPAGPKLLLEVTDFGRRIDDAGFTPDGAVLVVHGRGGPEGDEHSATAFALPEGRRLWTCPTDLSTGQAAMLDATGRAVVIGHRNRLAVAVDPRTGRELAAAPLMPGCFHWPSGYAATANHGQPSGWWLHRFEQKEPAVVLGLQCPPSGVTPVFDPSGDRLFLGQLDGSVTVVDIPRVRRELAGLDLDW